MQRAAALTDRQKQFVERIQQLADSIKTIDSLEYSDATPAALYSQLRRIDVALTKALQELHSLDLRHRERQDLASHPFNWPLVQALQRRQLVEELSRYEGHPRPDFISPAYPTELISEMESLRDAARSEAAHVKPGLGNSAGRKARAAARAKLGESFVLQYKRLFGRLPPNSKAGWVVDVMSEALCRAALDGVDAAGVLRRAIETHKGGKMLWTSD